MKNLDIHVNTMHSLIPTIFHLLYTAANDSDVIYVPTDNTVASNTEIINNICLPAKVPVIAGEEGICYGCGVATLSISYYDLGVATGEMAVKILQDGKISPQCQLNMHQNSQKNTLQAAAKHMVLQFLMIM